MIVQAKNAEQIETVRQMMLEYAAWLNFDLCFQGFDEELRTLPGKYAPPQGRLMLAYFGEQPAGMVAFRPMAEVRVCEMKRLYVRQDFRGKSVGRHLAAAIIREAAEAGYRRMRLDTVPGKMDSAIKLYRDLGFQPVAPYYETPVAGTLFLELAIPGTVRNSS
jgi:ribosomal protein S18 acetylase RimI-like enzyme